MRQLAQFPVEPALVGNTPVETTFEALAVPPPYTCTRSVFGWVFHGDELLLTCDKTGVWQLPGGERRPNETYREAFERNLWENAAARADNVRIIGAVRVERRGVRSEEMPHPHLYHVCFLAQITDLRPFSPNWGRGDRMLIEPQLAPRLLKRWGPLMDEMLRYVEVLRATSVDFQHTTV